MSMKVAADRIVEVQGHRGARGLLPENTLAGFELAIDVGVMSIETDVHLSRDAVPILFHDAHLSPELCTIIPEHAALAPALRPLVRSLTLAQLRGYRVRGPVGPATPLASQFTQARGLDAFGIPTLAELFEFVADYAGPSGEQAGKTAAQQERARRLVFDIELKRTPFQAETIGDQFAGNLPALLEHQVVAAIRSAGVLARTRVRSFDHRSMRAIRLLEPALVTGLLIHNTVPAQIGRLLHDSQAELYCPDYQFVDADVVRQVHDAGKKIMPYTVNDEADWSRLLQWGVDGITTDYPDRLFQWLDKAK